MRRSWIVVAAIGVFLGTARPLEASTESELGAAAQAGQAAFVVVTEAGAAGTDRALQIAGQAAAAAPAARVIVLDRAQPENRGLVEKYRVLGAPVPLILVVASNGVVAGGALLRDATPEVLVQLIPTPRKAEMLLHISQGRPVFVVVSGATMVEERGAVFEACNQALILLERKAATVVVDLDDRAERAWRAELKIGERELRPVTIVFNAKGQKTEVFRAPMTAEELVAAAVRKAACCPGGGC